MSIAGTTASTRRSVAACPARRSGQLHRNPPPCSACVDGGSSRKHLNRGRERTVEMTRRIAVMKEPEGRLNSSGTVAHRLAQDRGRSRGTKMITRKHTKTSNSQVTDDHRHVRTDAECQAEACEFLTELIGSLPADLSWDDIHHLQGHGHLDGHELVVIAPRDDRHHTVVLTAEDWDAVSHASSDQRRALLKKCAIGDHGRLVAALRPRRRRNRMTFAA